MNNVWQCGSDNDVSIIIINNGENNERKWKCIMA